MHSSDQVRIAHISDLHFGRPTFNPLQFFSKRWLGNLNLLLTRQHQFDHTRLDTLLDLFDREGVTHVAITGDLSVTSRRREFHIAKEFVEKIRVAGMTPMVIPGNHDQYTKRAYQRQLFYRFFPSKWDSEFPFDLSKDKLTGMALSEDLWFLALDTALATSLISSQGMFSESIEQSLEKALEAIPKSARIILLNHFPFFQHDPKIKQLLRAPALKSLLQRHRNVRLYMHGHTHRQTLADLATSNLPIISDSGATVHRSHGACHIITPGKDAVDIAVFLYEDQWTKKDAKNFRW
ncbi:MAG: 3',5'-cyclic adenosine monophosphate phosphodiesterase CpdA [Chlamydiae bacterium]|nr:3',5'-cyclic adenosine monophosphate phosphodiesterase CpdA [Chlamydiota bacterium]